ncbi:MAG TPA: cyclic nucleotide-binding domain-containing protein [Acidimicrobiia bacterium]|jgi:CRP-like cAMP-binding protein|nr:cyclic nucleotide-binding domain-containing protein [Acidimicrobiia bacterium]
MTGYDRSLYQTYLHSIPIFASCTTEQIDHLAQLGDAVTQTDGKVIVREGETGDTFYVVTSGKVRVTRGDREIASIGAGDYFGELALFDPAPRNATITAIGPVSLVSLSRTSFTAALDEMPSLRDALLQGMARRIHQLDQRV